MSQYLWLDGVDLLVRMWKNNRFYIAIESKMWLHPSRWEDMRSILRIQVFPYSRDGHPLAYYSEDSEDTHRSSSYPITESGTRWDI